MLAFTLQSIHDVYDIGNILNDALWMAVKICKPKLKLCLFVFNAKFHFSIKTTLMNRINKALILGQAFYYKTLVVINILWRGVN